MTRREQWEIDAEAEMTDDLASYARISETGSEKLRNLGLPVLEKPACACSYCADQPVPTDPRDTEALSRFRDSLCRQCTVALQDELNRLDLWNAVLLDEQFFYEEEDEFRFYPRETSDLSYY